MTKREMQKYPVASWVAKKINVGDKDGKLSYPEAGFIYLALIIAVVGLTGIGFTQVSGIPVLGAVVNSVAIPLNQFTSGFTGMSLAGADETQKKTEDTTQKEASTGGLGGKIVIPPGATDITLYVNGVNEANTSATEYLAHTGYFFKTDGTPFGGALTVTASSGGTSKTLGVGGVYRYKLVGSSTVNSRIVKSVSRPEGFDYSCDSGSPEANLVTGADGTQYIEFEVSGKTCYLTLSLTKRLVTLDMQAKSSISGGTNLYNTSSTTAADTWVSMTAGTANKLKWQSTADNSSASAIGSAGLLERQYYFKSNSQDDELNDFGTYYMIGTASSTEGTNTWQNPSVTLDGVALDNVRGSFTTSEMDKYGSSYYWAYLIPETVKIRNSPYHYITKSMQAKTAQNPTADIYNAFATRGNFLSLDGKSIKYASVKDDTSLTAVYSIFEFDDDIS